MSYNSGKNSGSFGIKKVFNKVFRQETGVSNTRDSGTSQGSRYEPAQNTAMPAIRQLNKEGFVIYNLAENDEIFVSNPSDKAFFDDGEPVLIRVNEEFDSEFAPEDVVDAEDASSQIDVRSVSPDTFFKNAKSKPEYGDINLEEVIIKKSEATTVAESPMAGEPDLMEVEEADEFGNHGDLVIDTPVCDNASAMTSDGAVAPIPVVGIIDYVADAEGVSEEVVESTVPEGLYVEGNEESSLVKTEESVSDVSAIVGSMPDETAVTEVEAQPAPVIRALPVPVIPREIAEVESDNTRNEVVEVSDIVADILQMTVSGLYDDLIFMSSFPVDSDPDITGDDGMESYDEKFRAAPGKAAASIAFGGRKIHTIGSSLNFTF